MIMELGPRKSLMLPRALLEPGAFEVLLCFHALMFVQDCMLKKLVSTQREFSTARHAALAVQLVMMAWNTCMRAAELLRTKMLCMRTCSIISME